MSYLIYDLDGTLVKSSRQIVNDMVDMLQSLKDKGYKNIIVSGGTYDNIKRQLKNRIDLYDIL